MATMVAVDLGAQSGRVAVGRYDGRRLTVDEVHRFPNVPVRTQGRLQWDVLRLYADVLDGLRAAARAFDRVDSVGVDSWAVDFGLLDARGRLVQNPVHYRDSRRPSSFQTVLSEIPARELYDRTGIQLIPINTIFELAAMVEERDPALGVAQQLLMVPDLVHYWLCGARVTEFTNATTTQCLDAAERTWAVDLLERLGVPAHLPAELVGPGTILGPLAADVAEETGLRDVRVIAPATHDTASAVVGAPLRNPGSAYISAGTWSLVGLEVDRPVIDDRTFAANLTNEGGVGGRYRLLRNVTGLWLLHECRRAWATQGRDYAFDELVALAQDAPPLRALVDPDDALFAAPGDMPRRIRDYCERTGQETSDDPAAVARCILESLALKHRQTLELLREATGHAPDEVHVVGGGSQNELLCQWTADAAGIPALAGPAEATEVGNLVVQAIALGELSSVQEGRELVETSFPLRIHEPRETAAWSDARERFAELVAQPAVGEGIEA